MKSSKTATSANLDGIDDILDGIFKKEKDSGKSAAAKKSKPDARTQPAPPEKTSASRSKREGAPIGLYKLVYFENYGKKYRALVAPISSLPEKPREQYDGKFRGDFPEWASPVFLCKNARKDVERSLSSCGAKPSDFVTPATEQTQKRFGGDPQEMRQGFVYCVHLSSVKHAAYVGFFKCGEDDSIDCRVLFDGFKIADEIAGEKVTCRSCKWVKELNVTPSFICYKNVFSTMKDEDSIDDEIMCKQHAPKEGKKVEIHDDQD